MIEFKHLDLEKECDICKLIFPHFHPDKTKPREYKTECRGIESRLFPLIGDEDGKPWRCPDCGKASTSRYGDTSMGPGTYCGPCYFGKQRKAQEEYEKEHSGLPRSRTELRKLVLDIVSFVREYHAELKGFNEIESMILTKYDL